MATEPNGRERHYGLPVEIHPGCDLENESMKHVQSADGCWHAVHVPAIDTYTEPVLPGALPVPDHDDGFVPIGVAAGKGGSVLIWILLLLHIVVSPAKAQIKLVGIGHEKTEIGHFCGLSVGSLNHVGRVIRLSFGGFSERMSVSGTGFHFVPLQTYKNTGKQVDANDYPCPPKSRSFITAQFLFYVLEFAGGLWLACFWGVSRLGSLDFWTTIRGWVGLIGGCVLVAHSGVSVTQKLLTRPYLCNTLIPVEGANMLSIDKQVQIVGALAEGSGIRQIEPYGKSSAKGRIVPVRFNPETIKAVEAAAKAKNQSVSEWIRSTLNAALQS